MSELTKRTADDDRICETVIDTVAAATGTDPLGLPQLYDTVDPDALNRLFRCRDGSTPARGRLEFVYAGCDVRVYADGRVVVAPSRADPPTPTVPTS